MDGFDDMKRFQDAAYLGFDPPDVKRLSYELTEIDQGLLPLLMLCLKSEWDDSTIEKTNLLIASQQIDWREFVSLAARLRVSAQLGSLISSQINLPKEVRKLLKDHYFSTVVHNAIRRKGLAVILKDFDQLRAEGINVIFLKGAGLADMLYKDSFVRISVDIDVIARRKDIPYIHGFLTRRQYDLQEDEKLISPLDHLQKDSSHLVYSKNNFWQDARKRNQSRFTVEVHYSPVGFHYRFLTDWDWLWENSCLIELEDTSIYVLNNEARFLNLCAHLIINHDMNDFLHVYELAKFIVLFGEKLNWGKIFRLARKNEFVRPVVRVLNYLERVWLIKRPAGIDLLSFLFPPKNREKLFFQKKSLMLFLHRFLLKASEKFEMWINRVRKKAEKFSTSFGFQSAEVQSRTSPFSSFLKGFDQLSSDITELLYRSRVDDISD